MLALLANSIIQFLVLFIPWARNRNKLSFWIDDKIILKNNKGETWIMFPKTRQMKDQVSYISNGNLQREAWKDVLQNVGAPKTHIDALTSGKLYHTSSKFVLPNSTYECCRFRHLQHPLHGNVTKIENYLHLHCTQMAIIYFIYVDAKHNKESLV